MVAVKLASLRGRFAWPPPLSSPVAHSTNIYSYLKLLRTANTATKLHSYTAIQLSIHSIKNNLKFFFFLFN
jgi:hypothetical protein